MIKKTIITAVLAAVLAMGPAGAAYAGAWQQVDDDWYYYDDNGEPETGWVQAEDLLWYYLDTQTGAWVRRPALSNEAAEKLLDNYILKMGYYQNESEAARARVDWVDGNMIYASVGVVSGPNRFDILNTYEINRKSGNVHPAVGSNFSLYD